MLNDNLFILTERRNFEYVALSIFPCKFFLKIISLRICRQDLLTFVQKTLRCFSFKVSNLFYTTFYLVYQSIAILWIIQMITLWPWLVPENLISLLSLLDSPRNNWKMIDWLLMKNKSGHIHKWVYSRNSDISSIDRKWNAWAKAEESVLSKLFLY